VVRPETLLQAHNPLLYALRLPQCTVNRIDGGRETNDQSLPTKMSQSTRIRYQPDAEGSNDTAGQTNHVVERAREGVEASPVLGAAAGKKSRHVDDLTI